MIIHGVDFEDKFVLVPTTTQTKAQGHYKHNS